MRTRLSICARKRCFRSVEDAVAFIDRADIALRHYRCDRCGLIHLTGRTKGKRIRRPVETPDAD